MTKRRDLILVIRVYYSSYFQRFFLLSEREFLLLVETSCCVFYRSSAMYYTLFSCVRVADIPRVTRPLLLQSNPRVVKSNATEKQTKNNLVVCLFLTGRGGLVPRLDV